MQNGIVQEPEKLELSENGRLGSRWRDEKGRMLVVFQKEKNWVSSPVPCWQCVNITLLVLEQEDFEKMPFERFVHQVATGKIKRYIPEAPPKQILPF
ncbi:hypothetical protein [Siphonobacter sp. SORGH_AS_0500]|uniref:hypothetical protein n=1 Tax=Siphonobacter sp. SORGH_AS_0500 TaxID=1864824 RepID=UPI002866CCD6|nr:hypothetical protein [Siphonobacter sp. SORGH_AS_0500]MDR6195944.1 hypothetical protein [Siphonobacter sp. SORGH_AS_0500]